MLALLFFSQVPVVILYSWIYLKDQKGREPISLLVKSSLLGALICVPIGLLELYFSEVTNIDETSVGIELLLFAMGVAVVEETGKFLVLLFYNYRKPELDEPFDGIMYSIAVSLGFAALENAFYVVQYGLDVALFRAFTAVPMHALTGVIMGYYFGRAKFGDPKNSVADLFKGLALVTFIHGAYDYGVFQGEIFFMVLILAIELRLARKAIKLHQAA